MIEYNITTPKGTKVSTTDREEAISFIRMFLKKMEKGFLSDIAIDLNHIITLVEYEE